jgi:hypothetical protein
MGRFYVALRCFLVWLELKAANPRRSYMVSSEDGEFFVIGERRTRAEQQEQAREYEGRVKLMAARREELRRVVGREDYERAEAQRRAKAGRFQSFVERVRRRRKQ